MATIRCGRGASHAHRIEDLSLGGVHLAGEPPVGVGEAVTISIHADGMRPIAPRGYVLRRTRSGFAVGFERLSAWAEDSIHDVLVRALESDRIAAVLIVDPDRAAREELARLLCRLGYRTFSAGTPIEAIAQLDQHASCIEAVLVSEQLTQTTGRELVAFLKDAFPNIRRVLKVDPVEARRTRSAVEDGLIHDSIAAPWHPSGISRALGPAARGGVHDAK